MENHSQLFDVCVICALPEEVRAFLATVRPHCDNDFEEHTSPRYGYSYRSGTLKNDKGELLTLHISWLPRYGPQEMILHLSHILEECQPRIAVMTGICAGDSDRVHLGDLVVAERTFTYDNGKFELDEQNRSVHLHDTLTYQLDANILQFLGLFDKWKPLVEQLKEPRSMPNQHKIVCHIKPMASGSAVRADNPFKDVQAPVRGTVAIDMEGAAVGLVMHRYPLTRWLIVKGVCDYADGEKNDTYHDYAASASAAYALSFIQAYVTTEQLPRLKTKSYVTLKHRLWEWKPIRNFLIYTKRQKKLLSIVAFLAIGLILFLGYHPPSALQNNIPPTISSVEQEDNSIHIIWDVKDWYDKYNILVTKEEPGKKPILAQISDQRSGEVWLDQITPNIRYTFGVEGCVEERFFQLTLHSSCTSWSYGVSLETFDSPIQQTYASLGKTQWDQPISPEIRDGDGWYHQDYSKGGSIYWSKGTGTLVIYGSIAQAWYKLGRGSSPIGYPLSEEHAWLGHPQGRVTCFQHGIITWVPEDRDRASVDIGRPCI